MRKVLLVALLASPFPVAAIAAENPPATASAQPAIQSWIDLAKKDAQESGRTIDEQELRNNFLRNELLSREAVRLGIDKQPDFAAREEIKRQELLAGLLVKDYLKKNPVSEDMLKAEYKNFVARLGNKEYSARHIQLKNESDAKDVIAQLTKGADFATLAKEKSLDVSSKDKGGQLNWVAKGALKPPLGDALSRLQKGLFNTVPLQTDAGWHVLKLEGVRDLQAPDYEKVKEQLRQRLVAQQINKLIESLRAQANSALAK